MADIHGLSVHWWLHAKYTLYVYWCTVYRAWMYIGSVFFLLNSILEYLRIL